VGNVRLMILLIVAALLVACGSAPAMPSAQAPAATEPATVTLWLDSTGGGTMSNFIIDEIVAEFNETHPDIQVRATLQANGWDAVRTALAGGAGPDIVITPGPSFVFELVRADQLLPLDDYASGKGWSNSFVPWALDLGKVNGALYSVPAEVDIPPIPER
jgi:raffinose/stachyose/melibiose transport system substrate-binding protein